MKYILKQVFSLILPITVLIIVPLNIEQNFSIKNVPAFLIGILFICLGLTLLVITVITFIKIGRGTLAPWSPTKKLITTGIYAHVRNPMISGVLIILIGESVAFLSFPIFKWALIFFVINSIWFLVYEEPNLEKKFKDEYRDYKKNVRQWIPKFKPYKPIN